MTTKHDGMWSGLGIDLEAHAGLLGALGDAYGSTYLSQKNRPEAMAYFDFVVSEIHGLRVEEIRKAKEAGRPVVGGFCLYLPEEVVLAAGGVCIGLCGGAEVGTALAEQYVPRNTCPLIKAFLGFKLAKLCPYVELTDLIVGETTCDGKKKAYEHLDEITGKMYVMELPSMKGAGGRELWKGEVARFAARMEELAARPIDAESLRSAVKRVNAKRAALQRLSRLRGADPCPISGLDALLVNQVSFYDDPERFTQKTNELCDELEIRVHKGVGAAPKGAKRVLVGGSPMAIPNWKLHAIIEGSGAIVVGEEACIGERNHRDLVADDFATAGQGLEELAKRYLSIDCACFTPNAEREGNIADLATRQKAQGFIHYSLQFCTPYLVEAQKVERRMELPFLKLETDYGQEDLGQLRTRVEAFLEML